MQILEGTCGYSMVVHGEACGYCDTMAGVRGDKGRKLQLTGAAPMTRLAAVASVSNNVAVSHQVKAPRCTVTTTSEVSLKQAATLDKNDPTSGRSISRMIPK